jgi:hypothetical protein
VTPPERDVPLDALGLGGGLGERDQSPARGDLIEQRLQASELVGDRDP